MDFFDNHSHRTVFRDEMSSLLGVTASIIQGSAIGPAAYVVTAGDLVATVPGNSTCKFADDTSSSGQQRGDPAYGARQRAEMAERNNLKLNCSKSTEVIFRDPRRRRHHAAATEPVPLPGIERSSCLKMLGVSIENNFSIAQHVQRLVTASAQTVYALPVLRTRGLDDDALQHIRRGSPPARVLK